jgi:hypothetical protein
MSRHAANIFFVLFAVTNLVSLVSLGSGPGGLMTRGPVAPEPFIRADWIDDFYTGDIYAAFEEAAGHRDAIRQAEL